MKIKIENPEGLECRSNQPNRQQNIKKKKERQNTHENEFKKCNVLSREPQEKGVEEVKGMVIAEGQF